MWVQIVDLISLVNGNVTERHCMYQRARSECVLTITHYSHSKFLFSLALGDEAESV